jgi:PAS domain S-box-containing protein
VRGAMSNHNNKNKQQLIVELQQALQHNAELQGEVQNSTGMSHLLQAEYLQTMMASLPHAIFLVDARDYLVRMAKIPGSSVEKPVDTKCYRAVYDREHPCSGPECPCVLQEAIKTKKLVMLEHRHVSEDGTIRFYEVYGYPLLDSNGEVSQIIEYPMEITDRLVAKEQSAIDRSRYQKIFDAATDGIVIIDSTDTILDANPKTCQMFGYTLDEIKQIQGKQLAPPEYLSSFSKSIGDMLETGEFFTEIEGVRKDGSRFDLEIKGTLFEEGDIPRMLGHMRDVTQRKKNERALQSREQELLVQAQNLQDANAALKVLLQHRDDDRKEFEELLLTNLKALVLPHLESIKGTSLTVRQQGFLEMLEINLQKIVRPFLQNLKVKVYNLTPAEIKVVDLIKEGKRTKEIADRMGLSKRTIDSYRYNIRKKLNLDEKTPLNRYLLSLQ